MQQASQVDARFEMIFLRRQRGQVGGARGDHVHVFEIVPALEMFMRHRGRGNLGPRAQ